MTEVIRYDLSRGLATLVSATPDGSPAIGWSEQPAVSADGRYVAFASLSADLVPDGTVENLEVFVRDLRLGRIVWTTAGAPGETPGSNSGYPALSADGRYVAYGAFSGSGAGVYLHDLRTGRTSRVDVDGRGNPVTEPATRLIPDISADGRYVVFDSGAATLTPGDTNDATDVFVRDVVAGTTRRLSVDGHGHQANGASTDPRISADGRSVVFRSEATNLVPADTNGVGDLFLRDLATGSTTRLTRSAGGEQADRASDHPQISADGRYVAFSSAATNLLPGPRIWEQDAYLLDRETWTLARLNIDIDIGTG